MRPVLPVDVLDVDEAQKRLVDQFGRLHAVVRTLAEQAPTRDAPQLVVDERQQRIQSRLVSLAPRFQENGDLGGRAQNSCILIGFCAGLTMTGVISAGIPGRAKLVRAPSFDAQRPTGCTACSRT